MESRGKKSESLANSFYHILQISKFSLVIKFQSRFLDIRESD